MNSTPHHELPDVAGDSRSERQEAGWDLRNAVRNYSTLVAAQVAVALFSFASVWLVTRQLGTDGYGGVVAVIAASQVVQIFVNWTAVSLARFGVEEFVKTGKINDTFWARTAIFLPNTIVVVLLSALWLPLLGSWLKLPTEAWLLVLLHFGVTVVWLHIQNGMQAAKLPRMQGILLAVERILIFSVLLFLTTSDRLDGSSAIIAYIAAPALMAIAGLLMLRKSLSTKPNLNIPALKQLIAFSLPLIPYSFIGYFSTNYLDAIFISQYLSRSDLGIYSIAYQMNGILLQFPLLAGTLLLPLFVTLRTSGKDDRVQTYMRDLLPLVTFIGGIAAAFTALVLEYFIPAVFSGDGRQASLIFWILISSAVLAIPTIIGFAPFTNALSATYVASILAAVAAVVNLAANYFLIPVYGLKGCAWATVVAYAASIVTATIIARYKFSVQHRWTIPAMMPVLAGSAYASATDDMTMAFVLAIGVAFVIVLIWHRAAADGIRMLRDYRSFVAGR